MVFLFDSAKTNGTGNRLLGKIKTVVPSAKLNKFDNFDSLFNAVIQSVDGSRIAILRAAFPEELVEFKQIQDAVHGVKILLVLPDHRQTTLARAHELHPRYLAYEESSFDDLAAVLQKMMQRAEMQAS